MSGGFPIARQTAGSGDDSVDVELQSVDDGPIEIVVTNE
jgi:hypothetical protein